MISQQFTDKVEKLLAAQLCDITEHAARAAEAVQGLSAEGRHGVLELVCAHVRRTVFRTFRIDDADGPCAAPAPGTRVDVDERAVVTACRTGVEQAWRALLSNVEAADSRVMLEHAEAYFRVGLTLEEELVALLREGAVAHTPSADHNRKLAAALVAGEEPNLVSVLPPGTLAPTYAIAATTVAGRARHAAGKDGAVEDELTSRLLSGLGIAALALRQDDIVIMLIPGTAARQDGDGLVTMLRPVLPSLLGRDERFGVVPPASREQVPIAVREAVEVLNVATAMSYHPGVYLVDDLLMETMLYRAPDLAHRLAARVAPLDWPGSQLLDTLEVFLASDQERGATARKLYVHPNTLSYRLRRIHQLTGLSPANSADLGVLRAGMLSRRLLRIG